MDSFIVAEVLKIALPSSVLIGAVGWLARTLIKNLLDKEMAETKNRLESDAKKQIEQFKSQLEIERVKLQTRYSGIFSKQAEAILGLFQKLEAFSKMANLALANAGTDEEVKEEFRKQFIELKENYSINRIFLPKEVDNLCIDFFSKLFKSVWSYTRWEEGMKFETSKENFERIWNKQEKALTIIDIELPKIKEEMISRFRILLGIEDNM